MALAFIFISLMAVVQCSAAPTKWIDLSYKMIDNATLHWIGQPSWKHDVVLCGFFGPKKTFLSLYKYAAGEHVGTHMDAPSHFIQNGPNMDDITIENFHGEGIVVNVSAKAEKNPNAELEISDLEEWEKKYGRIPDNPVVFMYCGRG